MDTGNTHAEASEHHSGLLGFFLNRTNRAPWNPTGIAILAVCFLPAAMLLHALNYARLGQPDSRRRALFSHFTVLPVFFWAAFFTDLPDALFWFVSVAYAVHFYKSQDSLYKEHVRTEGTHASLAASATLAVVAFGVLVVVVAAVYFSWWDAYFDEGIAFMDEGRFHSAEKIFLRISEEFGDDEPNAYWKLAIIRDERRDLPGAMRYIRRMLDAEPKNLDAARYSDELEARLDFGRGHAFIQEEKFDEAEPIFLRYLKLFPNDPNALWNLAAISAGRGDLQGALELARKSHRLDPGDNEKKDYVEELRVREGFERAVELIDVWQFDEAEKLIREYLEVFPDDAYVFAHLASIRHGQGKLAEAIAIAKKAVEMDPGNEDLEEFLDTILEGAPR